MTRDEEIALREELERKDAEIDRLREANARLSQALLECVQKMRDTLKGLSVMNGGRR